MHVGVDGGRLHLVVAGVGPRVADVVPAKESTLLTCMYHTYFTFDRHEEVTRPDGVVEEHCVLWHDADLSADRALGEPLDVLPVDEDLPALDVVEAEEEADHRALSGASRTDLREK